LPINGGSAFYFGGNKSVMKRKTSHIRSFIYCLVVSSLILFSANVFGAVINVPTSAYPTIQAGINAANTEDTVLVANGTYTGAGNKNLDFGGKAITVISENGPNNCIIDCEGNGRGFWFYSGEGSNSILSGFTITNGNALDIPGGGGILCNESSPTIINCKIVNNSSTVWGGGGVSCFGSSSSPIITNCIISENSSTIGGGIFSYFNSPTISNCIIRKNSADYGGGIRFDSSTSIITNSVIIGNTAVYLGGGILCSFWDSPTIINCTISGNSASNGGGIGCTGASYSGSFPYIINSILWANSPNEIYYDTYSMPTVTFCNIQGNFMGEGNINVNPLFLDISDPDPDNWNLHLHSGSPCIDVGTNDAPNLPITDKDGYPRIMSGIVDIGAYEYPSILSYTPVTPCRIVDTRLAGGAIPPNGIRSYNVWGDVASQGGNPAGCPSPKGEPYTAHINVTVVPSGNGNIVAYPFGATAPNASLVNYRADAQNVANSGTVKTCFNCSQDIFIKSNAGTAHVIIDVLGYDFKKP
jgi:hypothetical protein